jgi:hypothetical protein
VQIVARVGSQNGLRSAFAWLQRVSLGLAASPRQPPVVARLPEQLPGRVLNRTSIPLVAVFPAVMLNLMVSVQNPDSLTSSVRGGLPE